MRIARFVGRGMRWPSRASGGLHPSETPAADGEIVWSWRRDPGVHPGLPVRAGQRGQKRPFPGESAYKPTNIARGRPAWPVVPVVLVVSPVVV